MRALIVLSLLIGACGGQPPAIASPTPTREPGLVQVTALLDLSGSRSPKGDAQRNAIQLWTDQQHSRGGTGPTVRVRIVDVGGSDARLLIELRRAAEEERADAIIVGTPAPRLDAAVATARVPVLFTLPMGEPIQSVSGGAWSFALAPTPAQLAHYGASTLPLPPGAPLVVVLQEGRTIDPETAAFLETNDRADPVLFRWDRARSDLAATLRGLLVPTSRVYLAGAPRDYQGVVAGARLAPGATFLLSWLAEPNDLGELRDSAVSALWPAPRTLVLPAVPTSTTPLARREFLRTYGDRHGPPSAHAAAAFDALSLISLAAARTGGSDREQLRVQLETLTAEGVATTYRFSSRTHTGFAYEDLAIHRWSGSAPALWTPAPPDAPR